jgi:hypothetical protein
MTANYLIDAMFELRKYLWSEIVSNNILDPENYYSDLVGETISPILPVQQSPEMNHFFSGKTHMVYDKIGMSYEDNWLICCEQILFTIYSTDILEVNKIRNFMTDLFRRMDDSARDINGYSDKDENIKFHSIFIADISPTAPPEEMQGFFSTEVTLEIKYSRITDLKGRFL